MRINRFFSKSLVLMLFLLSMQPALSNSFGKELSLYLLSKVHWLTAPIEVGIYKFRKSEENLPDASPAFREWATNELVKLGFPTEFLKEIQIKRAETISEPYKIQSPNIIVIDKDMQEGYKDAQKAIIIKWYLAHEAKRKEMGEFGINNLFIWTMPLLLDSCTIDFWKDPNKKNTIGVIPTLLQKISLKSVQNLSESLIKIIGIQIIWKIFCIYKARKVNEAVLMDFNDIAKDSEFLEDISYVQKKFAEQIKMALGLQNKNIISHIVYNLFYRPDYNLKPILLWQSYLALEKAERQNN